MTEEDLQTEAGDAFDYEGSIGRLEEIASLLESQNTPLEQALRLYEEGVELARDCMKRLQEAELRITELKLTDSDTEE